MSGNSRFVTLNYFTQAATTLKNGTGGGAPSRSETSPFVMERMLSSDRKTVWQTNTSPGSTVTVDLDLGAALGTGATCAGIHGIRPLGGCVISTVAVSSQSSYSPGGSWTSRGTITVGAITAGAAFMRDFGCAFTSATDRYWRFVYNLSTPGSGFTLGKQLLGTYADLGVYYARGSKDSPIRYRSVMRSPGGYPVLADLGDPGREILLRYPAELSSRVAQLLPLADCRGTFTYIDPADHFLECFLRSHKVERERVGPSAVDGIELDMEAVG